MESVSKIRFGKHRRRAWGALALVPWLLLAACASAGSLSDIGRMAQPEGRLTLASQGLQALQWENNDLVIQGQYTFEPDHLEINGRVRLQPRLAHFNILEYLRVDIYFLDGDGLILGGQRLWDAGYANTDFFTRWHFVRGYAPPSGTRAITFGYTGRVRDGGGSFIGWNGGDGIDFSFWRRP